MAETLDSRFRGNNDEKINRSGITIKIKNVGICQWRVSTSFLFTIILPTRAPTLEKLRRDEVEKYE